MTEVERKYKLKSRWVLGICRLQKNLTALHCIVYIFHSAKEAQHALIVDNCLHGIFISTLCPSMLPSPVSLSSEVWHNMRNSQVAFSSATSSPYNHFCHLFLCHPPSFLSPPLDFEFEESVTGRHLPRLGFVGRPQSQSSEQDCFQVVGLSTWVKYWSFWRWQWRWWWQWQLQQRWWCWWRWLACFGLGCPDHQGWWRPHAPLRFSPE